jgi:hypothetical protein
MDEIVKQAIAKWPNVPHCYGWLALDARGNWRMRDERAQHLGLKGDKITQAALLGFINRNYACDERGCWYFQNGPQRVYVTLEATPFVARTDPLHGLLLQTGAAMGRLDAAYLTESGELILQSGRNVAQLDDRDLAQVTGKFEFDGKPIGEETLIDWIATAAQGLTWYFNAQRVAVRRIAQAELETRLDFVRTPRAA